MFNSIITYTLILSVTQTVLLCISSAQLVENKHICLYIDLCIYFYYKNICKALQQHITSDKHFGEPSSDLDDTTTHLSPHNLNPQHKQLEGKVINKHEQ